MVHNMNISIITITYNNLVGLMKTVNSVLQQSQILNIEYIIIDGGSSDGTKEYLESLPQYVSWISEPDRGISHAFNKGIEKASGDMLLFLNSGDSFLDFDIIKNMLSDISNNPVDILSYKVQVSDKVFIPSTDNERKIWKRCIEPHQGTFIKKTVFNEIGGFSEEYRIRMDYHFFARCKAMGYSFTYIPVTIVKYEPGGTSMIKDNRYRFWAEGMSIKFLYDLKLSFKDLLKIVVYRRDRVLL